MQLTQKFAVLASFVIPALCASVPTTPLTYDTRYDDRTQSLSTTTCSTGLAAKYPNFGALPTFPNIGGSFAVGGFDSPACGSCWRLSYTTDAGVTNTVVFTAINYAPSGFTSSLTTAENLTDKTRNELGGEIIKFEEIDRSNCGTN